MCMDHWDRLNKYVELLMRVIFSQTGRKTYPKLHSNHEHPAKCKPFRRKKNSTGIQETKDQNEWFVDDAGLGLGHN